jgi:4-diphosphocytidyl-2-C-methyl-D-erythritol kinase
MSKWVDGCGWSAWPAPAKLNLFLHITGRRADGYHRLQTVFQLLDWGDTVLLRPREDSQIKRVSDLVGVPEAQDLTVRAARLLQEKSGTTLGAEIGVRKQIPMGGGLGGGSSNAASVLVGLNALWNTGLSVDQLAALGLTLGADVPVFVRGHSAFAEGIGEELLPLDLPPQRFLIVDPGVSVPTAELFAASELTRDCRPTTIAGYLAGCATRNVFQPVVRARYAEVARALDWLAELGEPRLSGSGAAVFVPIPMELDPSIVDQRPDGMRAWIAHGVNRSPLLDAVAGINQNWA